MDNTNLPKSIIPNQSQHYLLKAATANFDEAKANWELLKLHLKIDNLDTSNLETTLLAEIYDKLDIGGVRLLPLVYKNLITLNDPLLQSIKSFYKYTWAKNQYAYSQAREIAKIAEEHSVNITLLKGMAIAFHYLDDPGMRVMEDIDIIIDPKHVNIILKILEKKYQTKIPYKLAKLFKYVHAATFIVGKTEIDVHWRLLGFRSNWNIFNESPSPFIKVPKTNNIFVLNPSYSFFHTIFHGIQPNVIPTVRWITDCYCLSKYNQIDWQLVIDLAKKLNSLEQLKIAITILPEYNVHIPSNIIKQINSFETNVYQLRFLNYISHTRSSNRPIYNKILDNLIYFYLRQKTTNQPHYIIILKLPIYILFRILDITERYLKAKVY